VLAVAAEEALAGGWDRERGEGLVMEEAEERAAGEEGDKWRNAN